ncbi:MAG: NADH:ubiquinone oxidoreductase subunit N, partial [Gammaproteobacteria bacterium]
MPDLTPAVPEIFVLGMACIILVLDLFLSDRQRVVTYWSSLTTLLGAALLTWRMAAPDTVYTFNGMFVADPLANALKMITYLVMAVVFLYSR